MKEEVEVSQIHHSRIIPIAVVIREPREFIRGGIAALANIVCNGFFFFIINRYISYLQIDVSTATIRKWSCHCNARSL